MSTNQQSSPFHNEANKTKTDDTQPSWTNNQEADDSKALQHGPENDPSVKNISKAETQTSSQNSAPPINALSQPTPIAKDSVTDVQSQVHPDKTESISKPYSSSSPPVQEISPAGSETTPKESSLPQNDSTRTAEPGATLKQASGNDALPSPKKQSEPKKQSKWEIVRRICPLIDKMSKPKPATSGKESKDEATTQKPDEKGRQISLIKADLDYIKKRAEELGHYNNQLESVLEEAFKDFGELKQAKMADIQELRKDIMKLKVQDPSKYKFDAEERDPFKNLQLRSKAKQGVSKEVLSKIPHLHKSIAFETSIEFKVFEARYNDLSPQLKRCLLCFSIFPENAIIRKRLMLQWWAAEGFASEGDADNLFSQLIEKGFIEPVNENRSLSLKSCKMHPFYRSALIMLAERAKFFNFSDNGEPTQNFSETFQSCLVGEGLISLLDLKGLIPPQKEKTLSVDDIKFYLEKLHLLINVDEHVLEFKTDWFSSLKNLNFLYLGRWKVEATDHIEVEDTVFLDGLVNMSCVKFLSLQGISNIIYLPTSILKLANLNILDLRACYNLETIPKRIGFLKNLTHLDMSECYLVEHMPECLSLLSKLRVLKGFVVGTDDQEKKMPCCTLDDLEDLTDLIKLCIYTGLVEFPKDKHVRALEKLEKLRKLTITWGGSALRATASDNGNKKDDKQPKNGNKKEDKVKAEKATQKKQEPQGNQNDNGNKEDRAENGRLPQSLEKLDLKCFPKLDTPYWLEVKNLKKLNLKKLYIRGGKLSDFGQYQDTDYFNLVQPVKEETWKVEVLRLKYLSEIQMEWRRLLELFPDLVYLEQVSCPKLSLFPCDAKGVWINKMKIKGD